MSENFSEEVTATSVPVVPEVGLHSRTRVEWGQLTLGSVTSRLPELSASSLTLLWWMLYRMDGRSQVHFHVADHHAKVGLSPASAYRALKQLQDMEFIAQTFRHCWLINPRLVHCGDRKKWKYSCHVFDSITRTQQETTNEPSDLQARSGQADDPPSDPVAQP